MEQDEWIAATGLFVVGTDASGVDVLAVAGVVHGGRHSRFASDSLCRDLAGGAATHMSSSHYLATVDGDG